MQEADGSPRADPAHQHHHSTGSVKIKGCCDRCALSKVKCDRQRPVCGRCASIGRDLGIAPPCNYSVSLRSLKWKHGPTSKPPTPYRQPKIRTPREQGSPNKKPRDCHQGYFAHVVDQNIDFEHTVKPDSGTTPPRNSAVWTGMGTNMQLDNNGADTPLDEAFVKAYLSDGVVCPQYLIGGAYSEPSTSTSSLDLSEALYSPRPSVASSTSSSSSSSSSTTTNVLFQGHSLEMLGLENYTSLMNPEAQPCCAARICNTIQTLLLASKRNTCTSPSQPAITLDQALLLCRNALESLAIVWRCPCAEQQGSEFSLAFMVHTLLCFFRCIVQAATQEFETPIRMGVYTIDAEDEQRIKLQLVRSELGKTSRIVEEFGNRFCGGIKADYHGDMLMSCLNLELQRCKDILDAHPL